jgi:hypothetical protein
MRGDATGSVQRVSRGGLQLDRGGRPPQEATATGSFWSSISDRRKVFRGPERRARRVPSAEASRPLPRGPMLSGPPLAPDAGTVTGTNVRSSYPLARVCRPTQAGHDVPRHPRPSSAGYSAWCRGERPSHGRGTSLPATSPSQFSGILGIVSRPERRAVRVAVVATRLPHPGPGGKPLRRPDVVRFEPSNFWRDTPASQHKPAFRSDRTGVTSIDAAAREL